MPLNANVNTTEGNLNTHRPLITPADILEKGTKALPGDDQAPSYSSAWVLHPDDDEPVEGVVSMLVGKDSKTTPIHMSALEAALTLEVTRNGMTIGPNRNTPSQSATTTRYPKVIFPDASKDNMPLHRLFGAAEVGERISLNPIIPNDLRGATNRKFGGPAKKGAWETVFAHCKRYAVRAAKEAEEMGAPLPFTVDEYLANLEALYRAVTARPDKEEAA